MDIMQITNLEHDVSEITPTADFIKRIKKPFGLTVDSLTLVMKIGNRQRIAKRNEADFSIEAATWMYDSFHSAFGENEELKPQWNRCVDFMLEFLPAEKLNRVTLMGKMKENLSFGNEKHKKAMLESFVEREKAWRTLLDSLGPDYKKYADKVKLEVFATVPPFMKQVSEWKIK